MVARRLKPALVVPPVLALLLGGLLGWLLRPDPVAPAPDPLAIANSTLLSVRDQGRLTPFVGRFVAVVTASETLLTTIVTVDPIQFIFVTGSVPLRCAARTVGVLSIHPPPRKARCVPVSGPFGFLSGAVA